MYKTGVKGQLAIVAITRDKNTQRERLRDIDIKLYVSFSFIFM